MAVQNTGVQWDAQGRPYTLNYMDERGRPIEYGRVSYIPPAAVTPYNSYGKDPKLAAWAQQMGKAPGASVFRERGVWDSKKGKFDQGLNWGNIGAMGVGAMFAAPAIGALIGAGGGTTVAAPVATTGGTGAGTGLGVTAGSPIGSSLFGGTVAPVAATTTGAAVTPAAMSGLSPVAANLFGPPAASPFVRTAVNTLANTGGGGGGNPFSGMGLLDIAKLGQQAIGQYLAYHASQGATEAQLDAAREALEFAKKAYEEQNAKEQARFEATEARRAPFREGALKAHTELRRILGI